MLVSYTSFCMRTNGEDVYQLFHTEGATCREVCNGESAEMKWPVKWPLGAAFFKYVLVPSPTCCMVRTHITTVHEPPPLPGHIILGC